MKYRPLTETVEATRWNLPSDHSRVKYYSPQGLPEAKCGYCGNHDYTHGVAENTKVCPGDWIVERADGQLEVWIHEEFKDAFERVR